jgi:hypothetical protein
MKEVEILDFINNQFKKKYSTLQKKIKRDFAAQIKHFDHLLSCCESNLYSINKRQTEIEAQIQAHAVGVQNVYNQFLKFEKQISTDETVKLIRYLEAFDPKKIEKEVQHVKDLMAGHTVQTAIREFREFKYKIIELLEMDLATED